MQARFCSSWLHCSESRLPVTEIGRPACATIEEYSDWLCELIDCLDLHRVSIVGHSMGSLVALCSGAKLEKEIQKIAL